MPLSIAGRFVEPVDIGRHAASVDVRSGGEMTDTKLAVVVLAAGQGTRMRSGLPKVLHRLAGRSMLDHVLDAVTALHPEKVVVVVGPEMERFTDAVSDHDVVVQKERLGTGHAVLTARSRLAAVLEDEDGSDVLVVYGDTPLIRSETLQSMRDVLRETQAGLVGLAFRPEDPARYGRIVLDRDGLVERIVEYVDADEDERDIPLCNAGILMADGRELFELVGRLDNDNAKGEYYLTDVFALARESDVSARMVEAEEPSEVLGVNDRRELATAEAVLQDRLRTRALEAGVTMVDPGAVWLSWDTELAADVHIEPSVIFGPGVRVERKAQIRAFSHLEGVSVGPGARVGPFARLRPGTRLSEGARVGNFVEVKNAVLGEGAKANHLSYVGDATVGAKTNIGAGTITCNYDGFGKYTTEIGAEVFIGSNTALVAPVSIGKGAIVGAGSTITRDVAEDALAVARGDQQTLAGGATRFRAKRAPKNRS
jgi:bifunctional UDP-N-acetylglucosamine pyrophosphorylase/glucosamine-1-phosphate N-acetyltransferase